ncbi:MAG: type IV secretory system conjugative DNA transfer family protein [Litorimonas sp.]
MSPYLAKVWRWVRFATVPVWMLWRVVRNHPAIHALFANRWAFWSILFVLPIFGLASAIGLYIASVNDSYVGASFMGFFSFIFAIAQLVLVIGLVGSFVLGLAAITYLSLTNNWYLFLRWRAYRKALKRDAVLSVTDDPLIARLRLETPEDNGFFLTYLAARPMLALPKRKLTYQDDRHVIMVAGSRAGKGISIIIPNLVHHKGSVIVFDPAGENFDATAAYRQQVLGQTVHVLDPFGITGQPSALWNPLHEIDFDEDPQALDKCFALAESLIEIGGKEPYWAESAQELLAMTIAYVGVRSIRENMNLPQVYRLLQGESLEALWTAMSRCDALGGVIARFGESCLSREKEFAGVVQTLRNALRFLNTASMHSQVASSSFSMKDLKRGDVSLYLAVLAGAGSTYRGWLRMLFDGAFDAMQDRDIPKPDTPTLFLMDEFPLLGRMERIKRAAGEAAKFGVKLMICTQDLTQLKEIYGDGWETFMGNSGLSIFFANNDLTTQKYLSEKLGEELYSKFSVTSGSSSGAGGGGSSHSTSVSRELRKVARVDQVARQTARRTNQAFFLMPDMKPMRLTRAAYFDHGMIPRGLVYKPQAANDEASKLEAAE